MDETDNVRKAFTKKENNEEAKIKAKQERLILREDFIRLSKEHSGLELAAANKFFDMMSELVAYSFNKSHAISYSIATFQCCWFLTYYPDEWVTSYLDYSATEKGKVAGKEDPKTSAMREIQKLGYKIFKPDINLSGDGYAMHPTEKKIIVPGITSIKGIGTVAIQELNANRPYKTVKDLLVHESGAWRHSKFNKRSLESMIKLEGLESMGIVGADKQIKNYQQLKNIVIGHHDELKRIASRKKNNDITPRLMELIELEKDTPDWTRDEKIDHWLELAGTVDMSLILTEEHWKIIERFDLKSIDEIPELNEEDGVEEIKNQFVWFIVRSITAKTTQTGKPYLELKANGDRFVDITIRIWNCPKAKEIVDKKLIKKNTVMSGMLSRNKIGISTFYNKIAPLLEAAGYGESDTPIG